MTDPVKSFELVLKEKSSKRSLALYIDNKLQNKPLLKPKDVISSVSSQLKAFQVADSLRSEKKSVKDLNKYKKSTFLSVNKLPVYDEAIKQTKFDTQCVSDTQLIDIIENVELQDAHRGMTQEFEQSFTHIHTNKQRLEENHTNIESKEIIDQQIDNLSHKVGPVPETHKEVINNKNNNISNVKTEILSSIINEPKNIIAKETNNITTEKDILMEVDENVNFEEEPQIEIFSQILVSKVLKPKNKPENLKHERPENNIHTEKPSKRFDKGIYSNVQKHQQIPLNSEEINKHINSQFEDNEILNQCIDINLDGYSEECFTNIEDNTERLNLEKNSQYKNSKFDEYDDLNICRDTVDQNVEIPSSHLLKNLSESGGKTIISPNMNTQVHDSGKLPLSHLPKNISASNNINEFERDSQLLNQCMDSIEDHIEIPVPQKNNCKDKDILKGAISTNMKENTEQQINLHEAIFPEKTDHRDTEILNQCIDIYLDENSEPNQQEINSQDDNTKIHEYGHIFEKSKHINVDIRKEITANCNENNSLDKDNIQFEENHEILNLDLNTDNIERPLSPIFIHKSIKPKSKSASPLIVSLDKFEHFESIAISLLDSNDFNTAKRVINSQILDKELHFHIGNIVLNERASSPVLEKKRDNDTVERETERDETINVASSFNHIEGKLFEIDKTTSQNIIRELTSKAKENIKANIELSKDVFEDEILFSSDEEDRYIHKEYQDLPFTCALETSFYDQSDVLDKTMYVGFQTASNRSIQVCTGSFAKAKSILGDVNDVTVTDLVKKCDESQAKMDLGNECLKVNLDEEKVRCDKTVFGKDVVKSGNDTDGQRNMDCDDENLRSNLEKQNVNTSEEYAKIDCNDQDIDVNLDKKDTKCTPVIDSSKEMQLGENNSNNFKGFMTANNNKISLSEKALARCKKVFQDIDLEENFDSTEHKEESAKEIEPSVDKNKVEIPIDDVLQTIDEAVLQEFENIEMSLEEDKQTDKEVSIGFKTANNKNIKISDVALDKMKDIFQDIDFNEDLNEKEFFEHKNMESSKAKTDTKIAGKDAKGIKDNVKMNLNTKGTEFNLYNHDAINAKIDPNKIEIGFRTAGKKNIKISAKALAKTKNIFDNIDKVKLPDKSNKFNKHDSEYPSTSRDSFTNIDFRIPDDAITISKITLNNGDSTNIGISKYTENEGKDIELLDITKPSTSKSFVGFKTANNKNIKISEKAWSKTKNMFNNIDDIELPKTKMKDYPKEEINPEKTSDLSPEIGFVGFKTANNKNIAISKEALAKTKSLFNDIDSPEFVFPKKISKEADNVEENIPDKDTSKSEPYTKGIGSKSTNKVEKTTEQIFIETKNIFTDIDAIESEFAEEFDKEIINNDKTHKNEPEIKPPTEPSTPEAEKQSPKVFIGFKTANNRNIKISNDALIKSRNIFKDIDSEIKLPSKSKADYPDFGKDITTQDNCSKNDDIQKPDDARLETKGITEVNEPKFQGFKTASNKQVKISTQALAKSKNIFKDLEEMNIKDSFKKDICPKELIQDENERPKSPVFQGFQTGNKNPVTVSAKALENSKKLFKDLDKENTELNISKKDTISIKPRFTGSQVLASNLAKTTDLRKSESISKYSNFEKDVKPFSGFQTASNKHVKISKEALLKSRNIFKDLDNTTEKKYVKQKSLYPEEIYQNEEFIEEITTNNEDSNVFRGFQTASEKPVAISKESLEKSKKLFQDIDEKLYQNQNDKKHISEKAMTETKDFPYIDRPTSFKGFHTANNNTVKISKESFAKSMKIFENIDKGTSNFNVAFQNCNSTPITISNEAVTGTKRRISDVDNDENIPNNKRLHKDNLHEIIDTQVMNNFDESLHTADFHATPIKSKRSGSPILSCPKAKRRKKFETPYNIKNVSKPIVTTEKMEQNDNKITFRNDYKITKRYTLKDLNNMTKESTTKIDPYLSKYDFDSLLNFEFDGERNDLTKTYLNVTGIKELFLNSVNKKLVPDGWLDNHLRLIIWKLTSYEIKFKMTVCTARNVVDQLKYRYDRELYEAQRPALRKIFEKDDVAAKTMVLCVAGIYADGVKVSSVTDSSNIELLLTDGWYTIRCVIDNMLSQLVRTRKITVGCKIVTSGAELTGSEQAVAPWEDTSSIRLKIFGNSTRRARWDARLGYHGNGAILSQLSTVNVHGGKVCKLRVFVTRVYPMLYVEKFEDGSTVTRSERLENLHQVKTEAERQVFMEKLYEEVQREFDDQESQDSEGLSDSYRKTMDSGSQIAKMMKKSKDPAEFRAHLTSSQASLLESHTRTHQEKLIQAIQTRMRDRMDKMCIDRHVVSLMKCRVAAFSDTRVSKGMLSIWKPNDGIREIIKEGAWIDILNVIPTAVRYSEIQLSAGRQSVFSASKFKPPEKFNPHIHLLLRKCYTIKDLASNPLMSTENNEIDTAGLIFLVDPPIENFDSTKDTFQNVYLTDADKNMICVNFWGGLKKFGFQNVLDTGQMVVCVNLQKRAGNTRKSIPQYRVTEFSYFTQTPKNESARKVLNELNLKFVGFDKRKFCEDCVVLKNNYSVIKNNNENVSPYRFVNHDINMSKNKVFVNSPLAKQDEFNLTGLDFESSFKQDTELSEEALQRKKKVNEKIARLKMYGEPPPLSKMHIINRSKQASSSYKSPLLSNSNVKNIPPKSDSLTNVASEKNTPEKRGDLDDVSSSPVLNRTYVKSVNPVKINFDVKDNNDSNVDHFAEEFDGSPPLSLD
ncbi:BRCA2, DNA repair associated [Anticarsia gemmatalis]|uniref:BRCA2, DNA repair associated n=1 Tax=Anticarsia gemmatalis TaxID=129554 RepID=UPI003F762D07